MGSWVWVRGCAHARQHFGGTKVRTDNGGAQSAQKNQKGWRALRRLSVGLERIKRQSLGGGKRRESSAERKDRKGRWIRQGGSGRATQRRRSVTFEGIGAFGAPGRSFERKAWRRALSEGSKKIGAFAEALGQSVFFTLRRLVRFCQRSRRRAAPNFALGQLRLGNFLNQRAKNDRRPRAREAGSSYNA